MELQPFPPSLTRWGLFIPPGPGFKKPGYIHLDATRRIFIAGIKKDVGSLAVNGLSTQPLKVGLMHDYQRNLDQLRALPVLLTFNSLAPVL